MKRSGKTGELGEDLAASRIKEMGYRILHRNYRNSLGEIDIIAMDKKTLVFLEVKTRSTDRFGTPLEAVTEKKQRKISQIATAYLKQTGQLETEARFDVVSVFPGKDGWDVKVIKNAFELAD